MTKKWALILALAFILGIGSKLYFDSHQSNDAAPVKKVAALNLTDPTFFSQGNKPVQIFNPADKRIRIVYFGFTHCPDVCPTSLAMLAGALNQLSPETRAQVWPIFISLDPERDTPAIVSKYGHYFSPLIEGMSAPLNLTTAFAHKYGVIFHKTPLKDSELKYTIDHSSYFYLLKPDGTLITKVPHIQSPAPLITAMNSVVQSQKGK